MASALRWYTLVACTVLVDGWLAFLVATAPGAVFGHDLSVALYTAGNEGKYQELGGLIIRMVNAENCGVKLFERPSDGSVENLLAVARGPNAFALTFPTIISPEARQKTKETVQGVIPIESEIFQVVVPTSYTHSDLSELEAWVGRPDQPRRVYVGMEQSGTKVAASHLFEALNVGNIPTDWSKLSAKMTYEEAAAELRDGKLSAGVFVSGWKTKAIERLVTGGDPKFKLLDISVPAPETNAHLREKLHEIGYKPVQLALDDGRKLKTFTAKVLIATNRYTDPWLVQSLVATLDKPGNRRELDTHLTHLLSERGESLPSPLVTDTKDLNDELSDLFWHDGVRSLDNRPLRDPLMQTVALALILLCQLICLRSSRPRANSRPAAPTRASQADPRANDSSGGAEPTYY